jgi:DNA-binding NarL/FixJ family response regulator
VRDDEHRSEEGTVLVRRAEVDEVERSVRDGRPVVLTGAAGIGKTTLARSVLADRAPVREAAARASLSWVPFSMLRGLVDDAPDGELDRVVARVLRDRPGSLLLDDLQWADEGSLAVAGRVAELVPTIATVRVVGAQDPPVVERLVAAGFAHVPVAPLDRDAALALVDSRHPHLDGPARDALVARAAGNPLLLVELGNGGRTSATLAQALYARLDTASEAGRTAMERLSVLGRPCRPELLGPGADELEALGLARHADGEVAVEHALLAEVVVAELGEEADVVRCALAAEVGDAEAAHLLARAGDRAGARERALRGAEEARGHDRAGLLALAVACGDPSDPDVDLRVAAARAHMDVGDPVTADTLVQVPSEAVGSLSPFDRGRLGLLGVHAAGGRQDYAAFSARVDATWPLLDGTDTVEEVELKALSTLTDTRVAHDGRPVVERARAAVALAERIGRGEAYARSRLGSVLLTAGQPGWAEVFEEAIRRAHADGDEQTALMATESLVLGLWISGDVAAARAIAHEQVEVLRGGPAIRGLIAGAYACLFDVLIDADRTGAVARGAPLLEQEPVFRCRPFLEAAVAIARADLGEVAAAEQQLRGAHLRAGDHGQWRSVVAWAEAEVAWASGDLAGIESAASTVGALGVGDYPPAVLVRVLLAHARVASGRGLDDIAPAVGLFPAWAAFADEWAGLVHAAAGDDDDAATSFAAAADGWAGSDRRSRVRCLWAAGEAARRVGAPDACDRLERTLVEAEEAALLGLASRARRSLRDLGVARPAPAAPGVAGLTGREAQLLQLVAAGRTSAQIAAELHLSRQTVDQVITTATRKLGAPNRRSAAARWRALAEGGASDDRGELAADDAADHDDA